MCYVCSIGHWLAQACIWQQPAAGELLLLPRSPSNTTGAVLRPRPAHRVDLSLSFAFPIAPAPRGLQSLVAPSNRPSTLHNSTATASATHCDPMCCVRKQEPCCSIELEADLAPAAAVARTRACADVEVTPQSNWHCISKADLLCATPAEALDCV